MQVESVAPGNDTLSLTGGQQVIGKQDFLELLVTQLQNQNPLDPVKNEDFAAQLAQFSSLEQMQNLNKTFEGFMQLSQVQSASSMIGREVQWIDSDSSEKMSGVVEKISISSAGLKLVVDGQEVPVGNINEVREPQSAQP